MSDEEYTIEVYALYHCDPGNSPLSIAEFNEIVGCNIPENEKVENHIRKLRAQFGPNEVIQMGLGVSILSGNQSQCQSLQLIPSITPWQPQQLIALFHCLIA